MKKILKITIVLLLSIFGVIIIAYSTFRIKEYFIGNKYVEYLRNNTITISTNNSPIKFENLNPEFYSNNIFLTGEIHEVESSQKIDFSLFKHLNQKINVKIYLAEMDIAQAYYMNKFIQNSTDLDLKTILNKWVVYIGRYNKDYYEKWNNYKKLYSSIPDERKFKIVGIERISDFELLHKLLFEKLSAFKVKIPSKKNNLILWGVNELPNIIYTYNNSLELEDIELLNDIHFNLAEYNSDENRDERMFQNFKHYYLDNNWGNKKLYGCFGFFHTLGGETNTFAGKLNNSEQLSLKDKIISMNGIYVDSYLTVLSESLPELMKDNGKFTRFRFSYDNMLTMYIVGIEDFKRATSENSISLLRLNGENSPYKKSLRGTDNFRILPLWDGIKIRNKNSVTTDYIQYVFFVRDADWSEPFK